MSLQKHQTPLSGKFYSRHSPGWKMVVNDDKEKKNRAKNREYLKQKLKITKHLKQNRSMIRIYVK
ncbi:hypothetical protein O9G_006022 [Rozella allomycis CSF55]|uniref:Uncharacterized protein n=1 Tax=Rozella allomycis (strain CSF55) TaxID=988480 RepID=A0A075AXL9_ROZAC|nr:hypothetical protein O9G_006022 [Rozella allomycis CSF55]|eukprot:EPZ35050.1 hypothetical protein O9G_006022 [Rozella allomycis CSF55]